MPRVSVCIPTYNSGRYLPHAVESVLGQDFTDFELVVVDNVSSDETPSLCRQYADPRFRYVRHQDFVNQSGNFNRCLSESRGEFLAILHADDVYHRGFLADRVPRFDRDPELDFIFGAVDVIDQSGGVVSRSSAWGEDRRFGRGELLGHLLHGCLVTPPSLIVRKAHSDRVGPFRDDLTWGHDWEWTMRLAEQGTASFVSQAFSSYRDHDGNGTAEILRAAQNGDQERRILSETFERISALDPRYRKLRRPARRSLSCRNMYFAEKALLNDQRRTARKNLGFAARADASMLVRPTFWALLAGALLDPVWYARYRAIRGKRRPRASGQEHSLGQHPPPDPQPS